MTSCIAYKDDDSIDMRLLMRGSRASINDIQKELEAANNARRNKVLTITGSEYNTAGVASVNALLEIPHIVCSAMRVEHGNDRDLGLSPAMLNAQLDMIAMSGAEVVNHVETIRDKVANMEVDAEQAEPRLSAMDFLTSLVVDAANSNMQAETPTAKAEPEQGQDQTLEDDGVQLEPLAGEENGELHDEIPDQDIAELNTVEEGFEIVSEEGMTQNAESENGDVLDLEALQTREDEIALEEQGEALNEDSLAEGVDGNTDDVDQAEDAVEDTVAPNFESSEADAPEERLVENISQDATTMDAEAAVPETVTKEGLADSVTPPEAMERQDFDSEALEIKTDDIIRNGAEKDSAGLAALSNDETLETATEIGSKADASADIITDDQNATPQAMSLAGDGADNTEAYPEAVLKDENIALSEVSAEKETADTIEPPGSIEIDGDTINSEPINADNAFDTAKSEPSVAETQSIDDSVSGAPEASDKGIVVEEGLTQETVQDEPNSHSPERTVEHHEAENYQAESREGGEISITDGEISTPTETEIPASTDETARQEIVTETHADTVSYSQDAIDETLNGADSHPPITGTQSIDENGSRHAKTQAVEVAYEEGGVTEISREGVKADTPADGVESQGSGAIPTVVDQGLSTFDSKETVEVTEHTPVENGGTPANDGSGEVPLTTTEAAKHDAEVTSSTLQSDIIGGHAPEIRESHAESIGNASEIDSPAPLSTEATDIMGGDSLQTSEQEGTAFETPTEQAVSPTMHPPETTAPTVERAEVTTPQEALKPTSETPDMGSSDSEHSHSATLATPARDGVTQSHNQPSAPEVREPINETPTQQSERPEPQLSETTTQTADNGEAIVAKQVAFQTNQTPEQSQVERGASLLQQNVTDSPNAKSSDAPDTQQHGSGCQCGACQPFNTASGAESPNADKTFETDLTIDLGNNTSDSPSHDENSHEQSNTQKSNGNSQPTPSEPIQADIHTNSSANARIDPSIATADSQVDNGLSEKVNQNDQHGAGCQCGACQPFNKASGSNPSFQSDIKVDIGSDITKPNEQASNSATAADAGIDKQGKHNESVKKDDWSLGEFIRDAQEKQLGENAQAQQTPKGGPCSSCFTKACSSCGVAAAAANEVEKPKPRGKSLV